MKASFRQTMKEIMTQAWQFIRRNGFTKSEALKAAWANHKLKTAMKSGIVKFWFTKVDGTIREAYGTLKDSVLPATGANRRANDTVQVYFDTEKQEYRCFKRANLIRMAI